MTSLFFCIILMAMGASCFYMEKQEITKEEQVLSTFCGLSDNEIGTQKIIESCFKDSDAANSNSYSTNFMAKGPNNQDWSVLCTRTKYGNVSFAVVAILTTTDKPSFPQINNHVGDDFNSDIKLLTSPDQLDFCVTVQGRYIKILANPTFTPEPYPKYEFVIETPSVRAAESHLFQGPIYDLNQTAFHLDFKFPY